MKAHQAKLKAFKRAVAQRAPGASAPAPAPGGEAPCDFPALMRDVTPLKAQRRAFFPGARPSPHPRRQARFSETQVPIQASGWFEAADTPSSFVRDGMRSSTLKRLRAGHWPICAELDLHGLTRYEAQDRLALFLQRAQQLGNTVRVIHGKGIGSSGDPVLKQMTRSWLSHHPQVLAFCDTSGGGALLVLLRRMTD